MLFAAQVLQMQAHLHQFWNGMLAAQSSMMLHRVAPEMRVTLLLCRLHGTQERQNGARGDGRLNVPVQQAHTATRLCTLCNSPLVFHLQTTFFLLRDLVMLYQ